MQVGKLKALLHLISAVFAAFALEIQMNLGIVFGRNGGRPLTRVGVLRYDARARDPNQQRYACDQSHTNKKTVPDSSWHWVPPVISRDFRFQSDNSHRAEFVTRN